MDCIINNFQYMCGKDYHIILENAKYFRLQDLVFASKYCDECPHKSILADIIDPVLHKIF